MADMKFSLILKADGAGNVTGQLKQVESAVKGVDGGTKSLSKSQNDLKRSTDQTTASMKQQAVSLTSLKTLFASLGIAAFITKIGQATDSIASFERGIKTISPSLGDATKSMEFVYRLANQMGLTLRSVRESFLDLASATQGTTLAGDETRKIFEAIIKAGVLMGKSQERIKLAFLGVSQMASLNVVSMEEVKQITENLGISLSRVAKAAGYDTVAAFRKAGEQGLVLATKVLPALADNLNEMTGGTLKVVNVFEASFNRLRTQWESLLNAIGTSGLVDAMASVFAGLASAINAVAEPVASLTKAIFSLKNEIGTFVTALGAILIVSKVTAGFTALSVAVAGAGGVTAAFTSLNAVAAVAFGPAGWIALGVGLLAGLVIQMNALKGKTVEVEAALDQSNRMREAKRKILESQGNIIALEKELTALGAKGATGWGAPLEDLARKEQILKAIAAEQEKIVRWSQAEGRWAADLAEDERKAADEAAKLRTEQDALAQALGKPGKAAKDTRRELEKLGVPYADLIEKYSQLYGVSDKVTAAVMKAESGFKAMAKSGKGAMGLMQVIPGTFVDMLGKAATDIYDVNQNIEAGTKYLGIMIKQFGDLPTALAAYNAGPGRVMQAVNIATKEGITWQEAFAKTFPKAWKETGPYIQKVLGYLTQFGEGKYEIDAVADAQKEAAEAAKLHDEALSRLDDSLAQLEEQTRRYTDSVKAEAKAAQDALLKAQDPEAYKEMIRAREQLEAQNMAGMFDKEAQAALKTKYAAEDLLEAYQVRQGWANSILEGFDQLWSNMIGGAENAMEALQKTLKSWLYAIGQWLLKQTLIIPVTAAMFRVSQQSLGGGLLEKLGGIGGTNGMGGAGSFGGMFSNIGSWFSGSSIADAFSLGVERAGEMIGAGWLENLGVTMLNSALPNWGLGLAGIAGGLIGSQFGGYGGLGGSLGGMGGALMGQALIPIPVLGAAIGAALGSLGGGVLGGMFGKEQIKGGTAYWNPRQGAGAAHRDTDPAAVELMKTLGETATQFDRILDKISGMNTNIFASGMWLDTDTTGRVRANYASQFRGMQAAQGFGNTEQAAKWFVDQMIQDVKIQLQSTDFGPLGDAFGEMFNKMAPETLMQELEAFAGSFESVIDAFESLDTATQESAVNAINRFAVSMNDMTAIMVMAKDAAAGYFTDLDNIVWGTQEIQKENEALIDTYNRAIAQYREYQNAMVMAGKGVQEFSSSTIALSNTLAEAAGGVDQLAALQSAYFNNFYTEEERLAAQQKIAAQSIAGFNETLGLAGSAAIDTKDELRDYIESLDLTTESGQAAYVEALKMADAINTLAGSATEATANIQDLIDTLSGSSGLSPGGAASSMAAQQQLLNEAYFKYSQGPTDQALQDLDTMIQEYLSTAALYYGPNSAYYTQIYNDIMAMLQALNNMPSYATGTPYVPQTGPAVIHQGEAITPASLNPNNPNINLTTPDNRPIVINITVNGNMSQSELQYAIRNAMPFIRKNLTRY